MATEIVLKIQGTRLPSEYVDCVPPPFKGAGLKYHKSHTIASTDSCPARPTRPIHPRSQNDRTDSKCSIDYHPHQHTNIRTHTLTLTHTTARLARTRMEDTRLKVFDRAPHTDTHTHWYTHTHSNTRTAIEHFSTYVRVKVFDQSPHTHNVRTL